jgi:hypothetical protein
VREMLPQGLWRNRVSGTLMLRHAESSGETGDLIVQCQCATTIFVAPEEMLMLQLWRCHRDMADVRTTLGVVATTLRSGCGLPPQKVSLIPQKAFSRHRRGSDGQGLGIVHRKAGREVEPTPLRPRSVTGQNVCCDFWVDWRSTACGDAAWCTQGQSDRDQHGESTRGLPG